MVSVPVRPSLESMKVASRIRTRSRSFDGLPLKVNVIVTVAVPVSVNLYQSSTLTPRTISPASSSDTLPVTVTGRVTVCPVARELFGSISLTGVLEARVPVKFVDPEQGLPGPAQVQVLDPLNEFPDTVAVSEVMVVVPPSSG